MVRQQKSEWVTPGIILALLVIGFSCWFIGLLCMWSLFRVGVLPPDLWAFVEAMSTALATAAVFSGGFIAYRELRELDRSRHLQVANELFAELNSPENINARR